MFLFKPYFYVAVKKFAERELMVYLKKKFPKIISIDLIDKEDLDLV